MERQQNALIGIPLHLAQKQENRKIVLIRQALAELEANSSYGTGVKGFSNEARRTIVSCPRPGLRLIAPKCNGGANVPKRALHIMVLQNVISNPE